jgi:hypothetical protein
MTTSKQEKNIYQRRPRVCKNCGSRSIATYYFGYPSEKFFIQAEQDSRIKIGGCCIELSEYNREWCCNNCGMDFYKKNEFWLEEGHE